MSGETSVQLHKLLAKSGVASRRQANAWLEAGRIQVNGQTASAWVSVTGNEEIRLDGDLAHGLMRPGTGLDREYVVRVRDKVTEPMLTRLRKGVLIEGRLARFSDIQAGGGTGANRWYYITLMEGRNREVPPTLGISGCACQ